MLEASRARARSRSPPSRARECRSADFCRPDYWPGGRRLPRTSKESWFDGPRSADPPRNHGIFARQHVQGLFPRHPVPATPFASAGNTGRSRSQPAGSSRRCIKSTSAARCGIFGAIRAEQFLPFRACSRAARADAGCKVLVDAFRHQELGVFRPAVVALCRDGSRRRRAARRARRRCPVCWASRSRCGYRE